MIRMTRPTPSRSAGGLRDARGLVAMLVLLVTLVASGATEAVPAAKDTRAPGTDTGSPGDAPGQATDARRQATEARSDGTLYTVATAHLDTQWLWTIQDTIDEYVPKTLRENFDRFEKYPDYVFNFEGAFRYMLAKEYYPAEYARLKDAVAKGRWHVTGSAIDAGDTNIPAPESLIRHVLYANRFFEREFGKTSADIFLPDCFGFGWALPSAAAHCGLVGFSTQKLTWGSSVGIPFDVGVWEGVDGSGLVAALDPGDYVGTIREDLSRSRAWSDRIRKLGLASGAYVGYHYYGVGDTGGAPDDESVSWLEKSLAGDGPLRVLSAASDRMYQDLTSRQIAGLPRYRGELLMTRHGTGCYTSQAAMKRWNRKNEQLAAAAERASVAASWLGGISYPREKITSAWIRFLWHHHHDDVTGTSTPLAYPFSWNDEILSMKDFSAVLADGAGAVSRALDTRGTGTALVVFNPLSFDREDVVEATVRFRGRAPRAIRVFGPDGKETPSQVLADLGMAEAARRLPGPPEDAHEGRAFRGSREDDRAGGALRILFLARVPSVGFAVFDVRASESPCTMRTGLSVGGSVLENPRYRVRLDENGDVAAAHDKLSGREVLSRPARLQLLADAPDQWPEWEVSFADVSRTPRAFVAGPASVRIVERGPVRVALEVSRQAAGSTFTQRIRLAAGGADATVDFDTRIDWQSPRTLVKAAFPLAVSNPRATYDLGLGTIQRGNNHEKLYEVPAQQWADVTSIDGRYGVAVVDDCKYGWDKPANDVLRLSLVHGPHDIEKDRGRHRLLYAIAGHSGDWRAGRVPQIAARINQPLAAFQASSHAGPLGKRFSLLRLDTPQVAVSALKKAEDGEEIVVRLFELHGRAAPDVRLSMAAPILRVREVGGTERPLREAAARAAARRGVSSRLRTPTIENGTVRLSMDPYRPRTLALQLAPPRVGRAAGDRHLHEAYEPRPGAADGPIRGPDEGRPFAADGFSLEPHAGRLTASDREAREPYDDRPDPNDRFTGRDVRRITAGGHPSHAPSAASANAADRSLLMPPVSTPVALPFDVDAVSFDEDRSDGDFDGSGHTLPGELLPASVVSEGIRFEIGPTERGANNALACRGQTIDVPAGDNDRVYILAAAKEGDVSGEFRIDGAPATTLTIHDFTGYVGQSQSLVVDGKIVTAARLEEPFIKDAWPAWIGTHRHSAAKRSQGDAGRDDDRDAQDSVARGGGVALPDGRHAEPGAASVSGSNEPYVFCYLFKYRLDMPGPPSRSMAREPSRRRLTLPRNDAIRIFAITAARNDNDDAIPASDVGDTIVTTRIRPKGGLAIGPIAATLSCDRADAAIRYTVNGAEPTLADPVYTKPIMIERDATVRARAFLGSFPADDVAVRSFRFGSPRPSESPLRTMPGLACESFEGIWRSVSGFADVQPAKAGVVSAISLEPRTRDVNFGLRFTGYIEVSEDGVYTFYARSDDGSTLSIGDRMVVDNDGLHGSVERSGEIALARGLHPLTVLFFQKGGDLDLEVSYEGPGIPRQPLAPASLHHLE